MIVPDPSAEALKSADAIFLFDPDRPEWHEVVVAAGARPRHGQSFSVLDIPVDSADDSALQAMRARIRASRQ
jgi:hypothetical protein